jgi:hypothetical protein
MQNITDSDHKNRIKEEEDQFGCVDHNAYMHQNNFKLIFGGH